MTALHGILHLEVTESMPDLLSGTIGMDQKLGVRLIPNLPVGVTLLGTSQEIEAWLDRIHGLLAPTAFQVEMAGIAAQIRPLLEDWVPETSDLVLYSAFMDWTTDGRHDLFAAHLNALYEPGPTEADLVHAEQDEALGSVFGVDDDEHPF